MSERLLVLGNTGFLGTHVEELAKREGWKVRGVSRSNGSDLRLSGSLETQFRDWKPTVIINCAAHVGGISYSRGRQATVFSDNARMTLNVLDHVRKHPEILLVSPIANCAYPGRISSFQEEDFWDGPVHESVLGYGGARRFSVLGSELYRQEFGIKVSDLALPNLYGPGDHLDPVRAHALGGLVVRIVSAKRDNVGEVNVWGSGKPIREWLYVEDAALALVLAAASTDPPEFINIGSGEGVSIAHLARMIADIASYSGDLVFDTSLPDGAPEKRMQASRAQPELGWEPAVSLQAGLVKTVEDVEARLRSLNQTASSLP